MEAIKKRSWAELVNLSPRARALCQVAEKMSGTPTAMTSADWEPLRKLGFDDTALLEVGHIIGIFNYLTRLADGFGLQLDPRVAEAGETGVALSKVD